MPIVLRIKPENEEVASYYKEAKKNHKDDLGFDLYIPDTLVIKPNKMYMIDHKVSAELVEAFFDGEVNKHYMLVPRSSIYKHKLILVNSIGIIDKGYRGNLMAVVYNTSEHEIIIPEGTRLFQLVYLKSETIDNVFITDKLSDSERGTGGLGSTGL